MKYCDKSLWKNLANDFEFELLVNGGQKNHDRL